MDQAQGHTVPPELILKLSVPMSPRAQSLYRVRGTLVLCDTSLPPQGAANKYFQSKQAHFFLRCHPAATFCPK